MNVGQIFSILLLNPITNALIAFYKLMLFLHIPSPLGFSIVLLTLTMRLILYPVISAQIKSAYKMQKVAPHISAMRERHKDDKKKQQEEMMRLYKEHGVNPAAGCLPLLIQIPLTIALYQVLQHSITITSKVTVAMVVKNINGVLYSPILKVTPTTWNTGFFGIPLSVSPSSQFGHNPVIILVPVLTGAFQFILSKMMIPDATGETAVAVKKDDMQSAMQTQSLFLFPVMIGFFSWTLPFGLALYWNTFTIFGIIQQYLLVGSGGMTPWINKYRK